MAFVEFAAEEGAIKAHTEQHGAMLKGRAMTIDYATNLKEAMKQKQDSQPSNTHTTF